MRPPNRGRGSPPLARGTDFARVDVVKRHRITPACAGNSKHVVCDARQLWDHPRLRGEQDLLREKAEIAAGSPPLARGTVSKVIVPLDTVGITPACAGNSWDRLSGTYRAEDHPRLRGEQHQALPVCLCRAGITPACAGNSALCRIFPPARRDHPRLRGEQTRCTRCMASIVGSPPLARGTAQVGGNRNMQDRITPACAGNSLITAANHIKSRDHPRLRGEQDTDYR